MSNRVDSVACPKCGAQPRKPCVTSSGIIRYDYPHLLRKKAHMTASLQVHSAQLDDDSRQESGPATRESPGP